MTKYIKVISKYIKVIFQIVGSEAQSPAQYEFYEVLEKALIECIKSNRNHYKFRVECREDDKKKCENNINECKDKINKRGDTIKGCEEWVMECNEGEEWVEKWKDFIKEHKSPVESLKIYEDDIKKYENIINNGKDIINKCEEWIKDWETKSWKEKVSVMKNPMMLKNELTKAGIMQQYTKHKGYNWEDFIDNAIRLLRGNNN